MWNFRKISEKWKMGHVICMPVFVCKFLTSCHSKMKVIGWRPTCIEVWQSNHMTLFLTLKIIDIWYHVKHDIHTAFEHNSVTANV